MPEQHRTLRAYTCQGCGEEFMARADRKATYCSVACKGLATRRPAEDRFWEKVTMAGDGPDDCWNWVGATDHLGYGRFNDGGRTWLPYRWLWEREHGPLDGAQLNHRCDNPSCVRPDHLSIGNQAANTRDMIERGRAAWQRPGKAWGGGAGSANPNSRLTERDVEIMRYLYWERGVTPAVLATWFPVARVSV